MPPQTRLPMIAVDDIGAIAALAFEHPGHWQGRTLELAGDEMPLQEVAEVFSRAIGHSVGYRQVPWDQFERQAGRELTIMFRWMDEVGLQVDISAVRREYPELMTFERWLHLQFQPALAG